MFVYFLKKATKGYLENIDVKTIQLILRSSERQ